MTMHAFTAGAKTKPEPHASRTPSARSLRGLDALSFLMADVRDGVGPFLAVFLKGTQHWSSADIGLVVGASGLAGAIAQIPAGMLVDTVRAKRAVVAISAGVIGLGCMLIAWSPTWAVIFCTQIALALVSAVIGPCLASLSLGIVGHRRLPARVSRNEVFNHAGNFSGAILAASVTHYAGTLWLFYIVCAFSVASAFAAALIRPADVDYEIARGGEMLHAESRAGKPQPILDVFKRRDLLALLATVVLFHFGNAAMLPLAGQMIAVEAPHKGVQWLGACVIAAQLVMVVVAAAVGRAIKAGVGRKKLFLIALVVLPVRGVLFALTSSPYAVIAIQLLDGVSAGIFGVVITVMLSDMMRGTGRFNFAQGTVSLVVGIGAALSNLTGGLLVDRFGFAAAFLALSIVAGAAIFVFAVFMPERSSGEEAAQVAHSGA
ncbi:MFS transporter [Ralstonia wenshanensis]|uniref:MFS transporter n=1 Tax=Ralstonia wenshanensis TaxID=2842456 RepID=UPI003D97BD36